MSFEIGPEYGNIVVECPFCSPENPNPDHRRRLIDFIQHPLGEKALRPFVEHAELLESEHDIQHDKAIDIAFGNIAVRNSEGEVLKIIEDELLANQREFNINEFANSHPDQYEPVESLDQAETDSLPTGEKFTVNNYNYSEATGGIVGEVMNNGDEQRPVTLRAVFYDDAGRILGKAIGTVGNVEPKSTSNFVLTTSENISGHSGIRIQVESPI